MRLVFTIMILVGAVLPAPAAPALARGTAIIDPAALRELDRGQFGLGRMLWPARPADVPFANDGLFALPSMAPVRAALEAEFDRYAERHKASFPNETLGVGDAFDFQLFDRALLYSPQTRFVLAGIVNRMDRAFVRAADCGEIRLVYRLTRIHAPGVGDGISVSPRLPVTLNLVLKAKGEGAAGISCAEVARRWLASGDLKLTGAELVAKLTAGNGPLDGVRPENIARIETNLQIAHAPKSATRDFRTDYLLKVFDYNARAQSFEEVLLENQIDRERILADERLGRDFKAWLLDPAHFAELDRGTVLLPEQFLARGAIAPTPAGFSISELQPAYGLVQGDGAAKPLFGEADVAAALSKAAARGDRLQNIRSLAGFERRLNDVTCSGCHQTRGIGGFHFPGVDWMAARPDNSTVVPGSPHFFGDQVRRRDILISLRDGRRPNFSRGFSARPQTRGSAELAGTEYWDGWGAHCYVRNANAADNDDSFVSWRCAQGLTCQPAGKATRMGMCFVK